MATTNATTVDPNEYTHGLTGVNVALDERLVLYMGVSIISTLACLSGFRLWQLRCSHTRYMYCLVAGRTHQVYWTYEQTLWWPWLKKQLIYAPLLSKRHNREIQLSKAGSYGTLPGRLHTLLIGLYVASNIAYTLLLPYGKVETARLVAELRGRTGMLATVNLIPLVLLTGRNNPLISLLKISFDTFNLFHRWLGRLCILQSIIHVLAWYGNIRVTLGPEAASERLATGPFYTFGLLAIIAFCLILVQSPSPIRHAFYECFLHIHQLLAVLGFLGVYIHLTSAEVPLPALPYIRVAIGLWAAERFFRLCRISWMNLCLKRCRKTSVLVEALPGKACRVTFNLARHITIRPGSHVYAYMPALSWWMSHPFSVAWTELSSEPPMGPDSNRDSDEEANVCQIHGSKATSIDTTGWKKCASTTTVSIIVQARTGMTQALLKRALASPKGRFTTPGFLEGPYAGHDALESYGTVVMFAGGAGITHHLVQVRRLVLGSQLGTVATRKIHLIWTIREADAIEWIRPWMDEILSIPGHEGILNTSFFITRSPTPVKSTDPHISMTANRCDPGAILDEILPGRVGATMVTVCGPGAFADEVRSAVRHRLHRGCIEMNEESFTW